MSEAPNPESRLEIMLREEQGGRLVTVALRGRLDIFGYRELAARLEPLLGKPGLLLLLDLAELSFIASSGWSTFVATRARLKRGGGRIAFAAMNADLTRVYQAMKMNELVPAFASRDEARTYLTAESE